ncbi:hypothetical protein [Sphaerisporangium fuscum]|uniref:hypothetical protein n=1 Tax=Sphaerisporangium fuscum TaxID=2835868 RepID=UPI001BDC4449|nr:hypothetical protein [Sphaerisporangium fuscum]
MAGRLLRRIGNGTIALAVGAAAVYAHTYVMDQQALDAPLTTHVAAGAVAATGRFSARIDKVVAARTLKLRSTSKSALSGTTTTTETTVGTPDVFVVVTLSATSPGDPEYLQDPRLRTRDDVEYVATDRVGEEFTLSDRPVQQGWWVKLTYVFEVPPAALPGASVVVTVSTTNGIYDSVYPGRYDQLLPEASMTLTPDDAATRRLLDEAEPSLEMEAS